MLCMCFFIVFVLEFYILFPVIVYHYDIFQYHFLLSDNYFEMKENIQEGELIIYQFTYISSRSINKCKLSQKGGLRYA